jgi:hypothetical protein
LLAFWLAAGIGGISYCITAQYGAQPRVRPWFAANPSAQIVVFIGLFHFPALGASILPAFRYTVTMKNATTTGASAPITGNAKMKKSTLAILIANATERGETCLKIYANAGEHTAAMTCAAVVCGMMRDLRAVAYGQRITAAELDAIMAAFMAAANVEIVRDAFGADVVRAIKAEPLRRLETGNDFMPSVLY